MGRALLLLCAGLLPGCAAVGAPGAPLLAVPAAVEGLSLRAFGRTTTDSLVSLVTGEDCSIARIGRGEAYCGRDDPPAPPPTCTRSLGAVDCWTVPPAAWPPHRGVADGPATLTRAQENDRIGWSGRLLGRGRTPAAPAAAAAPVAVITPAPGAPVAPAPEPVAVPPPQDPPPPERPPARRRARPAATPAPAAPAAAPEAAAPPVPVIEPAPIQAGPTAAEAARRALDPAEPQAGATAAEAARRALEPAPSGAGP